MKAEDVAQWVIDNRYPKNENDKVSDHELYHGIIERIAEVKNLAQPIVMRSCPFCGSDVLNIHEEPSRDKTVTWYKILHNAINECSASMLGSNKEKLIERWNSRA